MSAETLAVRAAVLREPGRPIEIETVRLDPPRAGEVQVRVAAAGVCHSDVHLADGVLGDGRWPMVMGHEGAGIVESVAPDVKHVRPGDRVAFCFVPSCGRCTPCRAGRTTLCDVAGTNMARGTLMDGTSRLHDQHGETLQHGLMTACFSERVVIDGASAVPLPPALPLWQAALLGCAVVTGVGAVRNVARVRVGETACVIGCGGVGLQVISGLVLSGASRIIAVDRDPSKLELASLARRDGRRALGLGRRGRGARALGRARASTMRSRSWDAARRSGSPGTRCGPAARPSSSGSLREASTSRCRRSSSSRTRACAAASTARAAWPPSCRVLPSSRVVGTHRPGRSRLAARAARRRAGGARPAPPRRGRAHGAGAGRGARGGAGQPGRVNTGVPIDARGRRSCR